MKDVLLGGVITLVLLVGLASYTTTSGKSANTYHNRIGIPLKQKGILVTKDVTKVYQLIKKGWIVEDVDVVINPRTNTITKIYTVIRY